MSNWPKGPTTWIDARTLYVSVPFTWNLHSVRCDLIQRSLLWDSAIVGGPAVRLMPDALTRISNVSVSLADMPGVLQRANPQATRTTVGCPNRCGYCAVPTIEGDFRELDDWPDQPIICDNNLLAASQSHFDRVCERLAGHGWADFNQGLDARLVTTWNAKRIAAIGKPIVRLALDSFSEDRRHSWLDAYVHLREAGIAKSRIRCYALIGWNDTPDEAWQRCKWIERQGALALPMWFHELDATEANRVTWRQRNVYKWTDAKRRQIMQWFYLHKRAVCDEGEGA